MAVIPYFVVYPGTWIDLPDGQVAHRVTTLLSLLDQSLTDAAISLGAYQDARASQGSFQTRMGEGHEMSALRAIFEQQVRAELGVTRYDRAREDEVSVETERRVLNDIFAAGRMPRSYRHRIPFVHAQGFLSSVFTIRQTLVQCERIGEIRTQAEAALARLDAGLPKLKGVRDSTEHIDERVLGEEHGRRIETKPITAGVIHAPAGGVLVVGSLMGDNFTNTLANGELGEVPVTRAAFDLCVQIAQDYLRSLPWRGGPRVVPW